MCVEDVLAIFGSSIERAFVNQALNGKSASGVAVSSWAEIGNHPPQHDRNSRCCNQLAVQLHKLVLWHPRRAQDCTGTERSRAFGDCDGVRLAIRV